MATIALSWMAFQLAQNTDAADRHVPIEWGEDSIFVVVGGQPKRLDGAANLWMEVQPAREEESSTLDASIRFDGDASKTTASLIWGGYLTDQIRDCTHTLHGVEEDAPILAAEHSLPPDQLALWYEEKPAESLQGAPSVPLHVSYDPDQGVTFLSVTCKIADQALWDTPGDKDRLTVPAGNVLADGNGYRLTATSQTDVHLNSAMSYVRGGVNPPRLRDFGMTFSTTSKFPGGTLSAVGGVLIRSTWHFFGFNAYFVDEQRQEGKELLFLLLGLLLGAGLQLAGLTLSAILDLETPLSAGRLRRAARQATRH